MAAALGDAATVHHMDGRGVPDGRQPVRDDHAGAAGIVSALLALAVVIVLGTAFGSF